MAKQSDPQKRTVERVMHEYKHGELESGSGRRVKTRRQAVAIALSEAGASSQESPRENRRNLRRTKEKERRGETARARKEGEAAQRRTTGERTKSELYAEARRREIPGRSKMSKAELEKAVRH